MALLGGMSNGKYHDIKKNRRGTLTQDELTRVSYLIGIFKALSILFSKKLADQWIRRPNMNPMFKGASPLDIILRTGMPRYDGNSPSARQQEGRAVNAAHGVD